MAEKKKSTVSVLDAVMADVDRKVAEAKGGGKDPRLAAYQNQASSARDADFAKGLDWAKSYFGEGNPEMKAVLDRKRELAFGDNRVEMNLERENAESELNRSLATGLRQLQGRLPSMGVRGGAAAAMASPYLTQRMESQRGLERDLALKNAGMQRAAMGDYEGTLTNERAGSLGMGAGFMSMGAGDRANSMQYVLGQDYLKMAREQAEAARAAADQAGKRDKPFYEKLGQGFGAPNLYGSPEQLLNTIANPVGAGLGQAASHLGPLAPFVQAQVDPAGTALRYGRRS